jgi:hypothetical protein
MLSAQDQILDAVRGRSDWEELESIGISVNFRGGDVVIENPRGHVAIAEPKDVAEGFINHLGDEGGLRRWAALLIASAPFVQLNLEGHAYGEVLLEGLWDVSAGEPVRESALLAAKELFIK